VAVRSPRAAPKEAVRRRVLETELPRKEPRAMELTRRGQDRKVETLTRIRQDGLECAAMLRCAARHRNRWPPRPGGLLCTTERGALCHCALAAGACARRMGRPGELYSRAIAMPDLAVSATGHESTGKQTQGVIGTSAAWLCLCQSGTAAAKSNTLPSERYKSIRRGTR